MNERMKRNASATTFARHGKAQSVSADPHSIVITQFAQQPQEQEPLHTMASSAHWVSVAQQWVDWDVNEGTKQIVQTLLAEQNTAELEQLFNGRVEFGTAGLRAAMAPGPKMMNDLVVIQTTQVRFVLVHCCCVHWEMVSHSIRLCWLVECWCRAFAST